MKYTETQVTLQDNLWQYFVEPKEFSFLKLQNSAGVPSYINSGGSIFTLYFELDQEVVIAQRTVKDAVALFGDLGGFSGFLITFLAIGIGSIPSKSFEISKAENLFLSNQSKKAQHRRS